MRMLKNKEEDRQQAREMQQSIRQLLENAAMDRPKADERNHTLEVKLGDMTETMMLALQAEMDVKIDQTLDNLRTKVAQAQENFKSDVKTEMQNEAKAAMAKIQKGLAESYQRCLAMQEDAKQRKKKTEAMAKAAKAMESKLASATSALEKANKETKESFQGRLDSLDAAIKKAGVQDTQATQMLNQLGTLQ